MSTNPAVNRVLQASAVILSFVLTAFAIELGKGTVPIPDQYQWLVPIINAAVTGALIFLPRPGSEMLARQVDHFRTEHQLSRSDLKVVPADPVVEAAIGHEATP
jgi:hypothetical protein